MLEESSMGVKEPLVSNALRRCFLTEIMRLLEGHKESQPMRVSRSTDLGEVVVLRSHTPVMLRTMAELTRPGFE